MIDPTITTSIDDYRDVDIEDLRAENRAALARRNASRDRIIGCKLTETDCEVLRESDNARMADQLANRKFYRRQPNGRFVATAEPDWVANSRQAASEWRRRTGRRTD